jgi:hypothetical protein
LLTALPMLVGYAAFGWGLVRATVAYRHEWLVEFRLRLMNINGPEYGWYRRTPIWQFLIFEALGAIVGFPGFGWILDGRPVIGVPMAMCGAMMAWGVVPLLSSPDLPGPLAPYPVLAPLVYLGVTTLVSVLALGWTLTHRPNTREARDVQVHADILDSGSAH